MTSITTLPLLLLLLLLFALLSSTSAQLTCGLGNFSSKGSCRPCQKGTYSNARVASSCTPCPAGTYNPFRGAQGLDICIECPAGTFNPAPGSTSHTACKKCPDGQFSDTGSPSCIACKKNQRLASCPDANVVPGTDLVVAYRGKCFDCIVGNIDVVCDETGRKIEPLCIDCGPNQLSLPNAFECQSKFEALNVTCDAGEEQGFFDCNQCRGFLFNDGTFEKCQACPPGSVGNKRIGADRCVLCPAGTAKAETSGRCVPCENGENSDVVGGIVCIPDGFPCPSNYFRTASGACLTCSLNDRFDKTKKECVACPRNQVSEGGVSTTCTTCPRGAMPSEPGSPRSCVCKPGFGFGDGEGPLGGGCTKCRPGTFSSGIFQYCTPCFKGTFAPSAGMEECMTCPTGTRQPMRGQTSCVRFSGPRCKDGLIKNDEGICVVPQTNCPPDTERVGSGSGPSRIPSCNPLTCPAGQALIFPFDVGLLKECGVCTMDQRYNPKSDSCVACGANQVSEGGLAQTCKNCPRNQESDNGVCRCVRSQRLVDGKCMKCPPGTFGYESVRGCTKCAAGTFTSGSGALMKCRNCRPGTFSETGARSCKPCPEGTTSYGLGDPVCVPVP